MTSTTMPFIPADFSPPRSVHFDCFRLEVLAPSHADPDFDAVRSSRQSIDAAYGPASWWVEGLTHAQNLDDLRRHEREFEERTRFAYAILAAQGDAYLGCLYIGPDAAEGAAAGAQVPGLACVSFWLSARHSSLDDHAVLAVLTGWLATAWPFREVVFPGRTIRWDDWRQWQSAE